MLRFLNLLTPVALAFGMVVPAAAGDLGGITPIKRLEASRMIYRAGLADQDPLMLIVAAKMRKTVPLTFRALAPEGGSAEGADPLSAEAMLNAAAMLAQGDPVMEQLVKDVRFTDVKGVPGGPVYSSTAIAAAKDHKYPQVPFEGGAYAEIYVEGQGQSNLDLFVYDGAGRLVCSDTDITDIAYCGWKPSATAEFTIQVINKGNGTQYSLVTN
ncbi:hypothetical protein [Roseovarius pelagicus]|uniref:Uncharacterized protein n=1 Tax=Roseovarius pelagicus TaxID=2980108 RepID=A0ABY6DEW8_9RHOB|nr:hypothetical protein [Roseovarius pelagicus]UXX83778.1 hypothetical protein N7U68_03700 [Roseovarius pelagicus]